MSSQRAKAHAKHSFRCSCGRIVHGNGAHAMHFFICGDRYRGKRDGHTLLSTAQYNEKFPEWFASDEGKARAFGRPAKPSLEDGEQT